MDKKNSPSNFNLLYVFCYTFLFLVSFSAKSQTVQFDTVKKQKYVMVDVQKTYERIIEKGYESAEIFESLGNYYYENKNFKKSKLYFDQLFKKYKLSQISPQSIERYKLIKN